MKEETIESNMIKIELYKVGWRKNEGENQQEDAKERQKVDQKREREEQKKEE